MGIWDQLRSVSDKVLNPKSRRSPAAVEINVAAAADKLEDYFSRPDHKEKIARILTNLGRLAVESAVSESLKGVTGGVKVYNIVKEGLKDQPSSQAAIGKTDTELTLWMEQVQQQWEKMQNEMKSMKKQQNELSSCAKPEERLEKLHEEMDKIKQQIESLSCHLRLSDPLKDNSTDPTQGSVPTKNDVKRVMIRSRL